MQDQPDREPLPSEGPREEREFAEPAAKAPVSSRGGTRVRAYHLEIGRVISSSFSIWLKNFLPFTVLSFVVCSPALVLGVMVYTSDLDPEKQSLYHSAVVMLMSLFMGFLLTATMTHGVFAQLRGQRAGIGECLRVGLSRLLPLIGVSFVVGFFVMIGFVLLIIPAFMVLCACYVAIPAAVVERPGVMASVTRSRQLTLGHRWSVFGLIFLFGIIQWVLNAALVAIVTAVAVAGGEEFGEPLLNLISLFVSVLFLALSAVVPAVLYHDLRVGKEGVAVEDLAEVFG